MKRNARLKSERPLILVGDGNLTAVVPWASTVSSERPLILVGDGNYCLRDPNCLAGQSERPLILVGDGNIDSHFLPLHLQKVGTAVNPRGGWKPGSVPKKPSPKRMSERPLILVGDGNTKQPRQGHQLTNVGTAVNPRGGWKQHQRVGLEVVFEVGTAVNPRGGWKLNSLTSFNARAYTSERPLILVGDGNLYPITSVMAAPVVGTAVNPRGGWKRFFLHLQLSLARGRNGR